MASVSVYLNFPDQTEAAFLFYRSVFGTEFDGEGIMRMRDIPPSEDMPPISEADQNLVMHVSLPLMGGFTLMGTDAPASMGFEVKMGNNVYINLQPDTRAETRRLFEALSADGKVTMPLTDMFWGDYSGACEDKFGVRWMFNCEEKPGP